MKVIKLHSSHCTTDSRCYGFASISNKIRHREEFGRIFRTLVPNIKVPYKKKEGTW